MNTENGKAGGLAAVNSPRHEASNGSKSARQPQAAIPLATLRFRHAGQTPRRRMAAWLFLALLGLLTARLTAAAASNPLQLRPATNLYASGVGLNVGSYAIPCVTDWNGDGKKDLLVGYQTDGMIRVYTNSGTDARPVFTSYYLLQAGGTNIQHTSGGCGAPAAWVCDFDGDGKRDLVVGSGGDGRVNFYRNSNTDPHP
ncbi:MAG: VCBS repeat-containing protein, partial [Verrucomicrobia bacterium]|nr:VCBS repeat-containing protein [Verrucomicrobiota bacterium]